MQVVQKFKSRSISGLGQTDGLRFSHRFGGLPRGRRFGIAWSVSGQRSISGASTSSDAPNASLSCPHRSPHILNRHPPKGELFRGEFPGCQRAIRLDYSPAIAVTRLGRITRGGEGTPVSGSDCCRTVSWKATSWLSGRAIKKDLKTTIAS